jgi:hypothetical protein
MKNTAFANGQFLMLRRQAYDAIGGHETVRDRFCEDVEIARLLKSTGWKPRVAWGSEFCAVRMYNSLENIFKGWGRIYYAGNTGSPWGILAGVFVVLACCFSAYAALAWGLYRLAGPAMVGWNETWSVPAGAAWTSASLAHLAALTHFLGVLYHWSGNPRRNALLFPLGGTLLLMIFFKSLRMCITKKVEWRGTSYSHVMADQLTPAHRKAG